MTIDNKVQLQSQSHGIKPDLEADKYHYCYYAESGINARKEQYFFTCSNDMQCCGPECCVPAAGGMPLWLLIIILVLSFLLLLLLILCISYLCWKYCCKKKRAPTPPIVKRAPVIVQAAPPPKVEVYQRTPLISGTLRRIRDDNLIEIKPTDMDRGTNTATTPLSGTSSLSPFYFYDSSKTANSASRSRAYGRPLEGASTATDAESTSLGEELNRGSTPVGSQPGPSGAQKAQPPDGSRRLSPFPTGERYSLSMTTPTSVAASEQTPFIPSPMEETFERAPTPIHISYHDETEITQEQRPLLSNIASSGEQKARLVHYRPFVPDPMEEVVLPAPIREQVVYHHPSEISKERFAEMATVQQPELKRAQFVYYIPGEDRVAAY